jgi:hypothetical protein
VGKSGTCAGPPLLRLRRKITDVPIGMIRVKFDVLGVEVLQLV